MIRLSQNGLFCLFDVHTQSGLSATNFCKEHSICTRFFVYVFSKSYLYSVGYNLYDSLIVSTTTLGFELGGPVNSSTYTLSIFGSLFFL